MIVLDSAGRLLLVKRGKPPAEGLWSIPGGRVEPDEDWEEACVRELREETGLLARVDRYVGQVQRDDEGGRVLVIRDYLMSLAADADPVAGDDAREARWVAPGELGDFALTEGLVEALTDWGIL
ncbi:MAG: NUDIX domain-containing protein [Actinomycetales bacterium]|nr:NUDIX domain-containing protein [Actinomycetales bacterium]